MVQDHLHHTPICGVSGSSSGLFRVVTRPLTSKPGLSPRFLRLISGSLRWDTYLSILERPPPGGSPDLKNQSCTGCGQRPRQNHLTSADKSISIPDRLFTFYSATGLPFPSEPSSTFVQPAIQFDKIGQALTRRLCPSRKPQHARPFAAGLGIRHLGTGRAEDLRRAQASSAAHWPESEEPPENS